MQKQRQLVVNQAEFSGKSVVYVMSRDQRAHDNHALLAAQELAIRQGVPLYVLFVLKRVDSRSREHYAFMLDGLREVAETLAGYDIPFVLKIGEPVAEILGFANEVEAGTLYFDFNPLIGPRLLVKKVATGFGGIVMVVDAHNIIPAWVVSDKQEFAAHTMRNKVHKKLADFLVVPGLLRKHPVDARSIASDSFDDATAFIESMPTSGIRLNIRPGQAAALSRLGKFISEGLETYAYARNDISADSQSGLSPYLHFGHVSSLRVALDVIDAVNEAPLLLRKAKLAEHGDAPSQTEGMDALLEEMIVRKELADNFCLYAPGYQTLADAPAWAQASLTEHQNDVREFAYTSDQWESGSTHDEIWNAAQTELTKTGKMHGYMRMYWAKKILEWSVSPEDALQIAIYLNDKYSIDGGDPNGYVGILWSIAGLHDRPWFDRAVYGKVRYMNASGLRRKFPVDEYISRVNAA